MIFFFFYQKMIQFDYILFFKLVKQHLLGQGSAVLYFDFNASFSDDYFIQFFPTDCCPVVPSLFYVYVVFFFSGCVFLTACRCRSEMFARNIGTSLRFPHSKARCRLTCTN